MIWPPEAYVFGRDGPVVVLSGRACAQLERALDLHRVRIALRGMDPELDTALIAIRETAMGWTKHNGSGQGTTVAADQEPTPRSDLSTADVAHRLNISTRAVTKAAKAGRLRGHQVDGRWRFDPTDVELFQTRSRT